jgi:hypothetical protein
MAVFADLCPWFPSGAEELPSEALRQNRHRKRTGMIRTSKIAKIDTTNKMTIAFNVSPRELNYFSEITGKSRE